MTNVTSSDDDVVADSTAILIIVIVAIIVVEIPLHRITFDHDFTACRYTDRRMGHRLANAAGSIGFWGI